MDRHKQPNRRHRGTGRNRLAARANTARIGVIHMLIRAGVNNATANDQDN